LNRQVDAIALTMVDHLARLDSFQVCLSYEYHGEEYQHLEEYFEFSTTPIGKIKITGIKPVPTRRLDRLSRLLFDCTPWDWLVFDEGANRIDQFLGFLESPQGLGLPVQIVSTGPTILDKKERKAVGIS
jgi:adenylosuccinate synthase